MLRARFSLSAVRRATAAALFFQWFIVLTGATVRLTGSGLGCPNWPTCTTTRAVPELEQHAMIEWLNRMTATPTLITALIALWACWRIAGRARPDLRIASSLVVVGVVVQAGVGALTVVLELPPEIVASHFLISIGLLAAATFAWHATSSTEPLKLGSHAPLRVTLAGVMLLSLLAVIIAGVLTTASGPHSGASGTGQEINRFGIFSLAVTVHARGAWLFLAFVLALTWMRRNRQVAFRDLGVLIALVLVQITLGEIQYRTSLPWHLVLAHVANAALLWAVAVRIAVDGAFTGRAAAPLDPLDPLADALPAVAAGSVPR